MDDAYILKLCKEQSFKKTDGPEAKAAMATNNSTPEKGEHDLDSQS